VGHKDKHPGTRWNRGGPKGLVNGYMSVEQFHLTRKRAAVLAHALQLAEAKPDVLADAYRLWKCAKHLVCPPVLRKH